MLAALGLAAALLAPAQDSITVQASLGAARIASGTSTVLVISVETGGETPGEIPVPPLPAGLEMGPISDFSQLQIAFPGGRRRITRREIVIVGREPGVYRIPPVRVPVGGRGHATLPLTLTVVPGAGGPAGPGGADAVRLRAWAAPDTVFMGQQILYRAEALFPEALRLRQTRAPVFDPPVTTGFWVYDLPDPVTVGLRVIGPETFEVQLFRQVLFPLNAGDLLIPEARMRYEFRAGSIFTPETRQLIASPIAVHVRPLPASGRPADFNGVVGSYRIEAELARARAAVHDAITLRLSIEGSGNLKALPRPELPPIDGADAYPGSERVEVGFADGRVSGRRTFEWLLVPRRPGTLTVPAIRYGWFDPEQARYQQAATAPLSADVSGSLAAASDSGLAPRRGRVSPDRLRFVRSPWFAAAQLLPLLLLAGLALRARPRRQRPAEPDSHAREELDAIARLAETGACLERLARLLRQQLEVADPARAPALQRLHERVRAARYAPVPADAETCARLVSDARALLAAGRAQRARASAPVVVLLLGAASGALAQSPLPNPAAPEDAAAGLAAAADAVRSRPRDGAAWYDLGVVLAEGGRPGAATWAWRRARQLEPRAADARHNLRVLGARRALEESAPRVPLSSDELRLLAAMLWWAGAVVLAAALRRRRRALPAAAALLGACAACLLMLGTRARPGNEAVALEAVPLHAAPVLRSEAIAEIASGEPVRIRELRGEWARVLSWDLREGWVERRRIGRL